VIIKLPISSGVEVPHQ